MFVTLQTFLNDIFQIFQGTTRQLHAFFDDINRVHPTLKFTLQHKSLESQALEDKCSCENKTSIPFLDT